QILDHRFRLVPLSRNAASEAILGPAALRDDALSTQPFQVAPEFAEAVLDYLTLRQGNPAPGISSEAARSQVEPFHLQLICRRVEDIVSGRIPKPGGKQRWSGEKPFTLSDFGGERALALTLKKFYTDSIATVSGAAMRRAARRLCEQYLISPEG